MIGAGFSLIALNSFGLLKTVAISHAGPQEALTANSSLLEPWVGCVIATLCTAKDGCGLLTPGGAVGMGPVVFCQGRCTREVLCKHRGLPSARHVQQQLHPSHLCSQEG